MYAGAASAWRLALRRRSFTLDQAQSVRFVSDTPPPALVDRMPRRLQRAAVDIKTVLRTMFVRRSSGRRRCTGEDEDRRSSLWRRGAAAVRRGECDASGAVRW